MFGLEDQKNKENSKDFMFDLEQELQDKRKNKAHKKLVEERIQQIKAILRSGSVKEEFDQFGILLHGYTSLLKVMTRFKS